jgi:hypothetical protein
MNTYMNRWTVLLNWTVVMLIVWSLFVARTVSVTTFVLWWAGRRHLEDPPFRVVDARAWFASLHIIIGADDYPLHAGADGCNSVVLLRAVPARR